MGNPIGCLMALAGVLMISLYNKASALDNGQGQTPPMGFNDWNELAAHYPPWKNGLNESDVLAIARAMVATGLRDAGYTYVNLDCGYSAGAKNSGKPLAVDEDRFPHGLEKLGQDIHAMGLKFGIYSSGRQCCDGNVRLGMEAEDASAFAAWGVDYVKYDDCGTTTSSFKALQKALNATGRPIFYSIHSPWTHHNDSGTSLGPDPASSGGLANCWRTTNDIKNAFSEVMNRAHINDQFAKYAGPHHWNDPDMLEVGNAGVTVAEGQSHFALWCLMKAPLLIGTDLTNATSETIATLGNQGAIAINQDPLGVQGTYVRGERDAWDLWSGPLAHGCTAALVIDLGGESTRKETISWEDLGISASAKMHVTDVWTGATIAASTTNSVDMTTSNAPHGCAFYKLCPV